MAKNPTQKGIYSYMAKNKSLKDYVNNRRKYISISDGETIEAAYLGFDIIPSKFNTDEDTVRYKLEIDGEIKPWDTSATSVADAFCDIEPGQGVSITRLGTGTKTRYEIKTIN